MPHAKPIGPYTIEGPLTSGGQWLVGLDRLLNRPMWIRIAHHDAEPIAHSRRQINRPGRLRWVNGARTLQLSWDAYEAPDIALWKADGAPAPWENARFWLGAAVAECSACIVGGEEPPRLDLDAVVLGQSGEFLLLEEPIRELGAFAGPALSGEVVDPAKPMNLVTALAARLQRAGAERRRQGHRTASDDPWPRHATLFFEGLASTHDPASVEAEMRRLLSRQPREGLSKRVQLVLTSGGIPLSILIPLMTLAVPPLWFSIAASAILLAWIGSSLFTAAVLRRRGYALIREEMQIVDIDGQLAGRGRLITRALVAWTPLTAALSIPAVALWQGQVDAVPLNLVRGLVLLAIALGILSSSLRRSIQDRLAGTWLVPE